MGRRPEKAYLTWDTNALLDHFGGTPMNINVKALAVGLPMPSRHTIAQWRYRNNVSADGIAFFFMLAHRLGEPLDMRRFIRFSAEPMTYEDAGDGEGPDAGEELLRADALLEDVLTDEELAALDAVSEVQP